MPNKLEQAAHKLGFDIVIEKQEGQWLITENILDCYAFELPIAIGNSEAEALEWLNTNLSEMAGK